MTSTDQELDREYRISEETVVQFRRDGWAPLPGLLSAELAAEILRRLTGERVAAATQTKNGTAAGDYQRVLRMHDGMAPNADWFRALVLSPRLTSPALRLIGQDDGLFLRDMLLIKTGAGGEPTPFHQDFPHWPFDRTGAFTIWIALTDVSEDMGSLRFLPGSAREGPLGRYSRSAGDDMCEAKPYLREKYPPVGGTAMRAGDATVHGDLTVHGSGGNTSGRERAAYTVRYMPTDVLYTGAPQRHFDQFGLSAGDRIADSPLIPHIGRNARTAPRTNA
jgi:ectoine hydroxylase-related dioxygenase (phytanoyl-CoA dioxygenase family)